MSSRHLKICLHPAYSANRLDQLHGIQVMDILALGTITKTLVITGKAQHIGLISKEAAPRISLCKATRFLSRVTICNTGSIPIKLKVDAGGQSWTSGSWPSGCP